MVCSGWSIESLIYFRGLHLKMYILTYVNYNEHKFKTSYNLLDDQLRLCYIVKYLTWLKS